MESLLEDIQIGRTLKSVIEFRQLVKDCAINIKSNDATFKIGTLPEVGDRLQAVMGKYIENVQKLEASQRSFVKTYEKLMELPAEVETEEPNDPSSGLEDLAAWEAQYNELVANDNEPTDQTDAQSELEQILGIRTRVRTTQTRQQDEDVVVEAPQRREIPKDPITKRNIKIAMICTKCNHIYDKTSIESYFEQKEKSGAKVRCPVAGCRVKDMKKSELIVDGETNELIESILNSDL